MPLRLYQAAAHVIAAAAAAAAANPANPLLLACCYPTAANPACLEPPRLTHRSRVSSLLTTTSWPGSKNGAMRRTVACLMVCTYSGTVLV